MNTIAFDRNERARLARALRAGAVAGTLAVATLLSACGDRQVQGSAAERHSVMAPASGNSATGNSGTSGTATARPGG